MVALADIPELVFQAIVIMLTGRPFWYQALPLTLLSKHFSLIPCLQERWSFVAVRTIRIQSRRHKWNQRTKAVGFLLWRDCTFLSSWSRHEQPLLPQGICAELMTEIKIVHSARVYRGDYDDRLSLRNMIVDRKWQDEIDDMWARMITRGIRTEVWYINVRWVQR